MFYFSCDNDYTSVPNTTGGFIYAHGILEDDIRYDILNYVVSDLPTEDGLYEDVNLHIIETGEDILVNLYYWHVGGRPRGYVVYTHDVEANVFAATKLANTPLFI